MISSGRARYYQSDPKEAKRLLADAGFAKGVKTPLTTTNGYGPDLLDAAQLVQHSLKDVGIETELKLQAYGAYMATTFLGKFEGMAMGPLTSRAIVAMSMPPAPGHAEGPTADPGPGGAAAAHF